MRWYLFIFLIIIPMVMADTTIRNGTCNVGETCLFSMYQINDSHIGNCNYFNYSVCYPATIPITYSNGSCAAGYTFILSSYTENNSHVSATVDYFDYSLCSDNFSSCNLRVACNAGEQGIVSLYQTDNSHVSEVGNYTNNICCANVTAVVPVVPSGGGGGGSVQKKKDLYDVSIHVKKNKYLPESEVSATIKLINLGDRPDKDTIITYYLVDPSGNNFSESKEQFYEVPPSVYNKEKCESVGGVIELISGRCVYKLERIIALPTNTSLGDWSFNVDYYTPLQGDIYVYDSFEVVKKIYEPYWLILVAIILIYGLEKWRIFRK